jgi:hypothetical protein
MLRCSDSLQNSINLCNPRYSCDTAAYTRDWKTFDQTIVLRPFTSTVTSGQFRPRAPR